VKVPMGEQGVENGAAVIAKSKELSLCDAPLTDFEDSKLDGVKRQRTASASPSPSGEPHRFASQADSDDGPNGRPNTGKKIRGAAARNHKEKEEREQLERSRQEAANKRKGRAERRRIDGEPREIWLRCGC
jgi:hypothetical protein